jgi:membrane-bound ClpP family serine protease
VVVTVLVLRFLPGGRARDGGGQISTTALSGDTRIAESGTDPGERPESLIGRRGAVVFALRPAGKAEIAGALRDVVAAGEFLDPGTPVEVVEVEGNRIVVRSIPGSPGPGATAGGPRPGAGG